MTCMKHWLSSASRKLDSPPAASPAGSCQRGSQSPRTPLTLRTTWVPSRRRALREWTPRIPTMRPLRPFLRRSSLRHVDGMDQRTTTGMWSIPDTPKPVLSTGGSSLDADPCYSHRHRHLIRVDVRGTLAAWLEFPPDHRAPRGRGRRALFPLANSCLWWWIGRERLSMLLPSRVL